MDPLTVVSGAAAKAADSAASEGAKVAGNLLTRLLGPLTDEVGAGLAEKYRIANVQRIARKAAEKADLNTNGAVPSRVAAAIFDTAQWVEEGYVSEYLSGVLAAARTRDGKDDSAVAWNALVARLPTSAIKLHYALYTSYHQLVRGISVDSLNRLIDRSFYVPAQAVMDYLEDDDDGALVQASLHLLQAEALISPQAWGPVDYLARVQKPYTFPEAGLILKATPRGMVLLTQALGLAGEDPEDIARTDIKFEVDGLASARSDSLKAGWVDELVKQERGLDVI